MATDQAFCATSIPTLLSALQEDNGERDELVIDIKLTEAAELCELVQVELALASNMSFKRLHLDQGCPDKLAFVIIQALQHNSVLKSFHFSDWAHTKSGDPMGLALAKALRHNSVLDSFHLEAMSANFRDPTGLALAEALRHNSVLKSFHLFAENTNFGDPTGLALAEALRHNSVLKSFRFYAAGNFFDDPTGLALAEVFDYNCTLLAFDASISVLHMKKAQEGLRRNRQLLSGWRALAAIARFVFGTGFKSLAQFHFRRAIFDFFLPAQWRPWPAADGQALRIGQEPCSVSEARASR